MCIIRTIQVFAIVFFALSAAPTLGRGLLNERKSSLRSKAIDAAAFQSGLNKAMREALGCGGQVTEQQFAVIEKMIMPVYRTIPKNKYGYIERRSLRFLAYRYFTKKSSLLIRGFEPSRPTNSSDWGRADILSQRVPAYVESVLQSTHAQEKGFSLQDAVQLVATLEQLIFDSESTLLEIVYAHQHKPVDRSLSQEGIQQILEEYMVRWLLGDSDMVDQLLDNKTFFEQVFPQWNSVLKFNHGQIKTMQFHRDHMPHIATRPGHHALSPFFSYEDAHSLVGDITKSFASFWESECATMKASLIEMDIHRTGRVPLSKFYHNALDSDWRFGESEAYLRELGALDESSWHGKQVIIPNYIQATSNCIVATTHYMVCCINDCETHLNEIETFIGAPTAPPAQILMLVGNMTATITLDDDEPPHLQGTLVAYLEQIATVNGGFVPIHGRLFLQWLHYVFPRECAYPYRTGEVTSVTPLEFGDEHLATDIEMQTIAANVSNIPATVSKEDLQWMSQWSYEEELILEVTTHSSWVYNTFLIVAGILAMLGAYFMGGIKITSGKIPCPNADSLLPTHRKAHFV